MCYSSRPPFREYLRNVGGTSEWPCSDPGLASNVPPFEVLDAALERSSYRHDSCDTAIFDGRRIQHINRPVLAPPSDGVEGGGGLTECVRRDVAQTQ